MSRAADHGLPQRFRLPALHERRADVSRARLNSSDAVLVKHHGRAIHEQLPLNLATLLTILFTDTLKLGLTLLDHFSQDGILHVAEIESKGHGMGHGVDRAWICGEDSSCCETSEPVCDGICRCNELARRQHRIFPCVQWRCAGMAIATLDRNIEPLECLNPYELC